jgi:uridine kinase
MPGDGSGGRWPAVAAGLVIGAVGRWRPPMPGTGARPGVLVVAIDGHGASGKSTIARIVAAATGAALIHTDDFFAAPAWSPGAGRSSGGPPEAGPAGGLREAGTPCGPLEAEQALGCYYDWRRLRAQALEPLLRGQPASFRRFDWDRGSGLGGTVSVQASDVIIVEGVFSAAPALSGLVDRSVFVDTPEPERLRRLRRRVLPEEWDDDWLSAERAYFAMVRPPASFDIVVPGADCHCG